MTPAANSMRCRQWKRIKNHLKFRDGSLEHSCGHKEVQVPGERAGCGVMGTGDTWTLQRRTTPPGYGDNDPYEAAGTHTCSSKGRSLHNISIHHSERSPQWPRGGYSEQDSLCSAIRRTPSAKSGSTTHQRVTLGKSFLHSLNS